MGNYFAHHGRQGHGSKPCGQAPLAWSAGRLVEVGNVNFKLELEMRKAVAHDAQLLAPLSGEWRVTASDSRRGEVRLPQSERRVEQAAQETVLRPLHEIDRLPLVQSDIHGTPAQPPVPLWR